MKQTLKEAAEEYTDNIGVCGRKVTRDTFIDGANWQRARDEEDHADMLALQYMRGYEDAKKQQSPWISVKDRLPESDDDLYFVLDVTQNPDGVGVAEFIPDAHRFVDSAGLLIHPTHWMTIPECKNKK